MGENRTLIDCNVYPNLLEIHSQFHHQLVSWSALLTKGSCNEHPHMVDPDNHKARNRKGSSSNIVGLLQICPREIRASTTNPPSLLGMNGLKRDAPSPYSQRSKIPSEITSP